MATKKPTKATTEGKCFNCSKPATEEYYCSGCKSYVCDACTKDPTVMGFGHPPEDHLNEEWE